MFESLAGMINIAIVELRISRTLILELYFIKRRKKKH